MTPPPRPAPLATLLARARAGDDEAFATIRDSNHRAVHGICRRWSDTPEQLEDLTQETFAKLLQGTEQFSSDRALRVWLMTVARNTAISAYRRSRVAHEPTVATAVPEESTERQTELRMLSSQLLAELPPRDAELMVEHYINDQPLKDMADRRGTSRDVIKVQLHRARERAREIARRNDIDGVPWWIPAPLAPLLSTMKGASPLAIGKVVGVVALVPLLVAGGQQTDPDPRPSPRVADEASAQHLDPVNEAASTVSTRSDATPTGDAVASAPKPANDALVDGVDANGALDQEPDDREVLLEVPATDRQVVREPVRPREGERDVQVAPSPNGEPLVGLTFTPEDGEAGEPVCAAADQAPAMVADCVRS